MSITEDQRHILVKTLIKYAKKANKNKNGRHHKSPQQAIVLEKEYILNPNWSKEKIELLSK